MSKLLNAPLLEVIYELKWNITNSNDLGKYQYLHGDLYALLKDSYTTRQQLTPPEIPIDILIHKPIHQYRKVEKGYPLYQTGPGILTLNTDDAGYYWEQYYKEAERLTKSFFEVYQYTKDEKFRPSLLFIDFFRFDFNEADVLTFLQENLHIAINQNFYNQQEPASGFNLDLAYNTEHGQFHIAINAGNAHAKQERGLILQTRLNGPEFEANSEKILSWLSTAQAFCSGIFKEMTKGNLYESFN